MHSPRSKIFSAAPVAVTVCLLVGVLVDRFLFHTAPADAAIYHDRVAAAGGVLPYNVGAWIGVDLPPSEGAVSLLQPNLLLTRRFEHIGSSESATFVLVHCRDARDLIGHYPPICYGNQGWVSASVTPLEFEVQGLKVPVTRYQFKSSRLGKATDICVDNFMVLPDGEICPDMDGITRTAQNTRSKFFGAAQVQLVSDASLRESEREALFRELIAASRPLIATIGSGVQQ
jgi:hypothetical protein